MKLKRGSTQHDSSLVADGILTVFVCVVWLLSYDIFRVLGPSASTILKIVDDSGGSRNTVRIRIRGRGSGFVEGPMQQELQEPLQFNVSADSEMLLQTVVSNVHKLIAMAKADLEA